MLRLRFLGAMAVERAGIAQALPASRKTRALLAYLALCQRPQRRSRLCSMLWDLPHDPKGALRWSLSKLRPLVDEPGVVRLVADRDTVAFAAEGASIDVLELRAALAGEPGQTPIETLEPAAAALGAELLEDLDLPDCRDFQAWLVAEREEIRLLRARVLRTLAERLADRPDEAAVHARALVAEDPLDPSAHIRLVRLLAAAGRRREAEQAHEAGRRTLAEAGAGAEWELTQVWRELCRGPRPAEPVATTGPRAPDAALPLEFEAELPSLAVLPFDNLTGDPSLEHIVDGIVEEVTAVLSRVRPLRVVARNSAFVYKGRAVDARQAARELGVRYLLEGSVRRLGDRLRITAQLIDGAGGFHLWAESYDGTVGEIFELQDRLSAGVAGVILPTVMASEIEAARRKRPESLTAYDRTMQALPHVWAFNPARNALALELLDAAVGLDPGYALAHALLAWCHIQRVTYNWTRDFQRSRQAALDHGRRALELDSRDPLVLTMLGAAESLLGRLEAAALHLERALSLDPNSAWAWNRSGWLQVYFDRPDKAIEHFQRSIALSPFDPMLFNCHFGIGCAHWIAGRPGEAVAFAEKALLENPQATWIRAWSAAWLVEAGRLEEARAVIARVREDYPDLTISQRRDAAPPNRTPGLIDRYLEALRLAGLPE